MAKSAEFKGIVRGCITGIWRERPFPAQGNLGKLLIGGDLRANFEDLVGCEPHKVRERAVMQMYHQMQGRGA